MDGHTYTALVPTIASDRRREAHAARLARRARLTRPTGVVRRGWSALLGLTGGSSAPTARPAAVPASLVTSAATITHARSLGLTTTQSQVFALLCDGLTDREIARRLHVTPAEATSRVQDVRAALEANRLTPAIAC